MTEQPSPITPPPELVRQWYNECPEANEASLPYVAAQAARWGADQELEACCALMDDWGLDEADLRAARRPNPPSLKEQALALIDECTDPHGDYLDDNALTIIRRALEALPDD